MTETTYTGLELTPIIPSTILGIMGGLPELQNPDGSVGDHIVILDLGDQIYRARFALTLDHTWKGGRRYIWLLGEEHQVMMD